MHGCSTLLTGHNADDQLETLLRRLFTAGSLSSLQGIRSRLEQDGITILRPVLNCPHKDLEAYLVEGGWAWSEDSTNKAETYQRNLLRRRMTGDLLSIFEGAYTALEVQTGRFADLAVFLESSVEKRLKVLTFGETKHRFPFPGFSFCLRRFKSFSSSGWPGRTAPPHSLRTCTGL